MISRKGTYTFITLHQKSNACNFTQQLNFGWTLVSRLQSPWYSMSCQWKMQWTCIPNNFLFLFLVILLYLWISQGFSWLSQGFSWHLKSNLIKPAKFDCIWIVNIKGHSTLIWINVLNVLKDSEIHQTVVHVTTKLKALCGLITGLVSDGVWEFCIVWPQ